MLIWNRSPFLRAPAVNAIPAHGNRKVLPHAADTFSIER
jgi:hypothetical protein